MNSIRIKGRWQEPEEEWQARCQSSIRTFSLRNTQWRRIWSFLGIRRMVFQLNWWFLMFSHKRTTAWYGSRHTAWMKPVPSNIPNHPTHVVLDLGCTRSINWIKNGNQNVPGTCAVLWHYGRLLLLQKVFCVCQLWDRNLLGKLYYPFSDSTSVLNQSRHSWDG